MGDRAWLTMSHDVLALLLSVAAHVATLDSDLQCSACNMFVETYLTESAKRWQSEPSVFDVYRDRLVKIYEEHNPAKLRTVESFLLRSKGTEHDLYRKVCKKYTLEVEEEYTGSAKGAAINMHDFRKAMAKV